MTGTLAREIAACRICMNPVLESIVDLGSQALASIFPKLGESDPPAIPLELVRCQKCGLAQLRHSVIPNSLYTYAYGYQSGINSTMRQHLTGIVDWIRQRCELTDGDLVVDVGCNDGTLLKAYGTTPALRRVGIDAIAGKFRAQYPDDITLHEGYFDAGSYGTACGGEKAKAITSIAMFYDLERPNEFVATVTEALAEDGIWVLEQSYLPTMLGANAFDTICHEHLEYYALRQIEWLAAAHGLRIFDAELNDCNGGSFRLAVCHADSAYRTNETALTILRTKERDLGLDTAAPFAEFARRIANVRDELLQLVRRERARGKSFYLYGASTKGNTLLQYCGLTGADIAGAAERNPEKIGCVTPRSHIPIVSEEAARAARPDYFLVLPWHFRTEFIEREREFRARGGKLVFPLPVLDVV